MKLRARCLLVASFALVCTTAAVLTQAPTENDFPPPIWNNPPTETVAGVEHRTFRSARVDQEVGYSILLPPAYESESRRYPVVYFLHGRGENENSNLTRTAPIVIQAMAARAVPPLVMVWVNGGARSFYVDSPDGRIPAETIIVTELVPHIDATYRTIAERRGRAIEGMSMGGTGALTLGMKHAELFGSVVAYAPAIKEVQERDDGVLTLAHVGGTHEGARLPSERQLAQSRWQFVTMFGGRRDVFERNSPWGLAADRAPELRSQLPIRIVIGTDDGLWNANQLFHELMLSQGYEHDFVVVPDVAHDLTALYAAVGLEALTFHARAGGWQ